MNHISSIHTPLSIENFDNISNFEITNIKKSRFRLSHLPQKQLKQLNNIPKIVSDCIKSKRIDVFDTDLHKNQCHVTALRIASIFERIVRSEELQDKDLLFLSSCLVINKVFNNNFDRLSTIGSNHIGGRAQIKAFQSSLKDGSVQKLFRESAVVSTELFMDEIAPDSLKPFKADMDKFASMQKFIKAIRELQIPIIFRIRGIQEGVSTLTNLIAFDVDAPLQLLDDQVLLNTTHHAAVVFEGFSIHDSDVSTKEFLELRKRCSGNIFSGVEHQNHEGCHNCFSTHSIDERSLEILTQDQLHTVDILLAGASDFAINMQLVKTQEDTDNAVDRNNFHQLALELGLANENPSTFMIEHSFAVALDKLNLDKRQLDQNSQEFVNDLSFDIMEVQSKEML